MVSTNLQVPTSKPYRAMHAAKPAIIYPFMERLFLFYALHEYTISVSVIVLFRQCMLYICMGTGLGGRGTPKLQREDESTSAGGMCFVIPAFVISSILMFIMILRRKLNTLSNTPGSSPFFRKHLLTSYVTNFGFNGSTPSVWVYELGYLSWLALTGTQGYLAPEFVAGKIGSFIDVYSYGIASVITMLQPCSECTKVTWGHRCIASRTRPFVSSYLPRLHNGQLRMRHSLDIGVEKQSADVITPEMEKKLWLLGILQLSILLSLLNAALFYNGKSFALRRVKEQRDLR